MLTATLNEIIPDLNIHAIIKSLAEELYTDFASLITLPQRKPKKAKKIFHPVLIYEYYATVFMSLAQALNVLGATYNSYNDSLELHKQLLYKKDSILPNDGIDLNQANSLIAMSKVNITKVETKLLAALENAQQQAMVAAKMHNINMHKTTTLVNVLEEATAINPPIVLAAAKEASANPAEDATRAALYNSSFHLGPAFQHYSSSHLYYYKVNQGIANLVTDVATSVFQDLVHCDATDIDEVKKTSMFATLVYGFRVKRIAIEDAAKATLLITKNNTLINKVESKLLPKFDTQDSGPEINTLQVNCCSLM